MRVHAHIPVGEIAASLPRTTQLFDKLGIDYICHGDLSLRDACAEAGVDPSVVRNALESLPREDADRENWADASLQDMLDELVQRRHPRLHRLLDQTSALLAETPDALAVRDAFCALRDALANHVKGEDETLFPMIQYLEDCWTRNQHLPAMTSLGGVRRPALSAFADHVQIIDLLRRLHAAASRLANPQVLKVVTELERELREHIHLENNVLLPRAVAIEAAVTSSTA